METKLEKNNHGGVIAIDRHGNLGIVYNMKKMIWASEKDGILKISLKRNEVTTIKRALSEETRPNE